MTLLYSYSLSQSCDQHGGKTDVYKLDECRIAIVTNKTKWKLKDFLKERGIQRKAI